MFGTLAFSLISHYIESKGENVMICPRCGKENWEQHAKFCWYCGAPLGQSTVQAADEAETAQKARRKPYDAVQDDYVLPDAYACLCPKCGGAMFYRETCDEAKLKSQQRGHGFPALGIASSNPLMMGLLLVFFIPLLFLEGRATFRSIRDRADQIFLVCERCKYVEREYHLFEKKEKWGYRIYSKRTVRSEPTQKGGS